MLDFAIPFEIGRASKVIPLAPRRREPHPHPATRQNNPRGDPDRSKSDALWDPFPGRFTKTPLAIAAHYGPELSPTRTQILEAMHHLIYGYGASPVGRHRRGQISHREIAKAAGVSVRTVERRLPELIKKGFVKQLSPGQRNRSTAVYELTLKAPTPRLVGPSGGRVATFPECGDYRQSVGSDGSGDGQPTTDRMSAVSAVDTPGTTDRMSAVTTDKLSAKDKKERQNRGRTRSRKRKSAKRTLAAAPAAERTSCPRSGSSLNEWPQSVAAICDPSCFPSLSERNLELIFTKAQSHQLSDEELAEVVRLVGVELLQQPKYADHPVVWGYELIDCTLRLKSTRPRAPAFQDEPIGQPNAGTPVRDDPSGHTDNATSSLRPTIELSTKRRCPKHKHEVIWTPRPGKEVCVNCEPPTDNGLREEASRRVQEWFDEEKRLDEW